MLHTEIAKAVALRIAIWGEATTAANLPPTSELVRIELPAVLLAPLRSMPELAARLSPGLAVDMAAHHWQRGAYAVPARMLEAYCAAIGGDGDSVACVVAKCALDSDPMAAAVARRGGVLLATADQMTDLLAAVHDELGLSAPEEGEAEWVMDLTRAVVESVVITR